MFRARVKNRRLLNQLKKKTQLRAILKSFRRYQTGGETDIAQCYYVAIVTGRVRSAGSRSVSLKPRLPLQRETAAKFMTLMI